MQRLRYKHFQYSNKSGKYLTNQMKRNKGKTTISTIINSAGNIVQAPEEITHSKISIPNYIYKPIIQPQKISRFFFNNIQLLQLTKEQAERFEQPLTLRELLKALNLMPNNKSPGPDDFPANFYKYFWNVLSPVFYRSISEIKQQSKLPSEMNTTTITLLLKPNKDPTSTSSYRPLSFTNTDTKIISKTLAWRIETVILHIIHSDQTGFIKGRQFSNNVRRLVNLIHHSSHTNTPTAVILLNAKKAFDKVNWQFLIFDTKKNHLFTGWRFCTQHQRPPSTPMH